MAGCTSIKALSSLFCAAVASLVVYNFYLYHHNLYQTSPVVFRDGVRIGLSTGNGSLPPRVDISSVHTSNDAQEKATEKFKKHVNSRSTPSATNAALHQINSGKTSNTSNGTQNIMHAEKKGYILALKIYEQQTMATGNLLQLQCFGSQLNMAVVQPLIQDSSLSTPLDYHKHTDMLQLEDMYNMIDWRRHTDNTSFIPLVPWEEFAANTPQNVVLVQMKYPTLTHLKAMRKAGQEFPLNSTNSTAEKGAYQEGCGYKVVNKAFEKLDKTFKAVHRVCYNFFSGEMVPMEAFRRELLLGYDPSNVTVIIDEWRGFGENQRVLIRDKICSDAHKYRDHTHSSTKVTQDAKLYIMKHLGQAETSEGYLAVIARFEMTAITCRKHDHSDPHAIIPYCLQETMKEVELLKKEEGLRETFLSSDIGKFGSKSFLRHNYYDHQQEMEDIVGDIYESRLNISGWERTFEETVESADAGYVALVQQAIVARAKCILFVGGGTFQRHTLNLYNELHPNQTERCVRVLKHCTSNSRRPVL